MSVEVTKERLMEVIKRYAGHDDRCDAVQPMWHQGPCDCGWKQVQEELGIKPDAGKET